MHFRLRLRVHLEELVRTDFRQMLWFNPVDVLVQDKVRLVDCGFDCNLVLIVVLKRPVNAEQNVSELLESFSLAKNSLFRALYAEF